MDNEIKNIKSLIVNGKVLEAIDKLRVLDSSEADDIFLVEMRFKKIEREKIRDVIGNEDYQVSHSKIIESLLLIINKIAEKQKTQKNSSIGIAPPNIIEKDIVVEMVKSQMTSIKDFRLLAFILIAVAILIFIWSFFNGELFVIKFLGALLIASLSGFPIRQVMRRREKISMLKILIAKIDLLVNQPHKYEDIQSVNKLFWSVLNESFLKS